MNCSILQLRAKLLRLKRLINKLLTFWLPIYDIYIKIMVNYAIANKS
jgi:hypothetical protein